MHFVLCALEFCSQLRSAFLDGTRTMVHTQAHTHRHTHTHARMHARTHARMRPHTHTHTQLGYGKEMGDHLVLYFRFDPVSHLHCLSQVHALLSVALYSSFPPSHPAHSPCRSPHLPSHWPPPLPSRYCECFASGAYCDAGCHCTNCCNNAANESIRNDAVLLTLERNPHAFQPKIAAALPHTPTQAHVHAHTPPHTRTPLAGGASSLSPLPHGSAPANGNAATVASAPSLTHAYMKASGSPVSEEGSG